MDKRKTANKLVKNRLFSTLTNLATKKDISKVTVTELINNSGVARASFYRNFRSIEELVTYGIELIVTDYFVNAPYYAKNFMDKELLIYTFQFYRKYKDLVLTYYHANFSISLLSVITDCFIDNYGDMPANSIQKYRLYYYSGAIYNIIICWLENGAIESPEEMAIEFFNIMNNQ